MFFWMTVARSSRSPEVIEVFSFFVARFKVLHSISFHARVTKFVIQTDNWYTSNHKRRFWVYTVKYHGHDFELYQVIFNTKKNIQINSNLCKHIDCESEIILWKFRIPMSKVKVTRSLQDTTLVKIEIRYLARVCLRIDLKRSEAEFEINSETHECEISDLNFYECGIVVLTHIIPFFDSLMST